MSENHDTRADMEEMQVAAEICRQNALAHAKIGNAIRQAMWERRAAEYDAEALKLQAIIEEEKK